jgi:hypothetical protein
MPLSGLYGQQVKLAADTNNWALHRTARCSLEDQIEVDKKGIYDINPARREMAIHALENNNVVLLSNKQFKELVYGDQLTASLTPDALGTTYHPSDLKPYLVRAVSANTTNRRISVHWCHRDLLIFSGSLGGGKPQKDPVVVFLKTKPRRVFLSYMDVE